MCICNKLANLVSISIGSPPNVGTFMKSTFVSPECLRILNAISVFYKKILWDAYSAYGGTKLVNFVYFSEFVSNIT